jgi:hypothetical protein
LHDYAIINRTAQGGSEQLDEIVKLDGAGGADSPQLAANPIAGE